MKSVICAVLSCTIALTGCGTLQRAAPEEGNRRVERIDEAASLHTSITSVTPWEDIKEKLRTNFALKPEEALAKSIPTTLVRLDRVLDILRFQLALTPSITRQSSTTTTNIATGKDPTGNIDTKTEKTSPDLPTQTPPTGLTASAPTTQTAPDNVADATLQYQTAANLLRDIAVLNAEIDNVARRTGHDAYLTRIQVSVLPLSRGLGYDVYANLSLFAATGNFRPEDGARVSGKVLPTAPLVVPILSTDAVQATRRTNSSQAQREVGFALNLLKAFGALGASAGTRNELENQAAGADLESVITIGRLNDNTIRIRLSADALPGGGYGMIPRTFNMSAVVFVPKSATQLRYVSRLSLHHVADGSELSAERKPSYEESVGAIAKKFAENLGLTREEILQLDDHVLHGDYATFAHQITRQLPKDSPLRKSGAANELTRNIMYLWADLIALNRRSRHAFGSVDIPRAPTPVCPSTTQLVAYASDEKGVTATLHFGEHLRTDALVVRLGLGTCTPPGKPAAKPMMTKALPAVQKAKPDVQGNTAGNDAASTCRPSSADVWIAGSVTPSKDGKSLTLAFPPTELLTPIGKPQDKYMPHSLLVENCVADKNSTTRPKQQIYAFAAQINKDGKSSEKSSDASVTPAIVPDSMIVVANRERKGKLAVVAIGGGKDNLRLVVRNATVTTVTDDSGKAIVRKEAGWAVSDGGRYVFSLENLSEAATVRVELQTFDGKKAANLDTKELRVDEVRSK